MSSAQEVSPPIASRNSAVDDKVIAAVAEAIARLRFGAVVLTVHGGKVVQLDVTERQRFS